MKRYLTLIRKWIDPLTADKIGLDIHGVIDTRVKFFSRLTWCLTFFGWEVHVMTGSRLKDGKIKEWLDENKIYYTHLFSISDHLGTMGVEELPGSTPSNPWFNDKDWNRAKAWYSRKHQISLVLDDNDHYFEHFTTPIARYYSKDK